MAAQLAILSLLADALYALLALAFFGHRPRLNQPLVFCAMGPLLSPPLSPPLAAENATSSSALARVSNTKRAFDVATVNQRPRCYARNVRPVSRTTLHITKAGIANSPPTSPPSFSLSLSHLPPSTTRLFLSLPPLLNADCP